MSALQVHDDSVLGAALRAGIREVQLGMYGLVAGLMAIDETYIREGQVTPENRCGTRELTPSRIRAIK